MLRRSRIPLNSVNFHDGTEEEQQITPRFRSDLEKAISVHDAGLNAEVGQPKTPEETRPTEAADQRPRAGPPRLQALLRLEHLLRPSPSFSSGLQRRIISEPFSVHHQQSLAETINELHRQRPHLSKSDQRLKPSSKIKLLNVTGLKSHYAAQVSDIASQSDIHDAQKSSETTSSMVSYRYDRSPAPSPPSSFSSSSSDGTHKDHHSHLHQNAEKPAKETGSDDTGQHPMPPSSLRPASMSSALTSSRLISPNLKRSPQGNRSTSSAKEQRLQSYLRHIAPENPSVAAPVKPFFGSLARQDPPDPNKSTHVADIIPQAVPKTIQNIPADGRPKDEHIPARDGTKETWRRASRALPSTRSLRAQSAPVPHTRPTTDNQNAAAFIPMPANHAITTQHVPKLNTTTSCNTDTLAQTPFLPSNSLSVSPSIQKPRSPLDTRPPSSQPEKHPQTNVRTPTDPQQACLQPIRTQGLSSIIKSVKYGVLQLALPKTSNHDAHQPQPDDRLELRFWLSEDLLEYLGSRAGNLLIIRQDGTTIQWMTRDSQVPIELNVISLQTSIDTSSRLATFYQLTALPNSLIQLFRYLNRCINSLKSRTPLIVFQISSSILHQRAHCTIMINGDKPDIVIDWRSNQKIKISRIHCRVKVWIQTIAHIDKSGRSDSMIEVGKCDEDGVLADELVERLRMIASLRGENELHRLDDRLETVSRCLGMTNKLLGVLESGSHP